VAARFTLLDSEYFEALCSVCSALEREGLPFCLVGGAASQAWVASLRTGDGARRLSDEPVLHAALRRTRDLDFSTRAPPQTMLRVLNELAATSGTNADVLGPRALRLGHVSVAFTVDPSDLAGMEGMYEGFLRRRASVRLRRGSRVEEIPVIAFEDLLVTKLTRRGDKAKDIADVTQLLAAARDAGRSIDIDAIRRLLEERPEALELLREIEASSATEEMP
jgi:hypothetical protein